MDQDKVTKEEWTEFCNWKAQGGFNDELNKFIKDERMKIKANEIVKIPREYMYLTAGIVSLLVISIFPVILFGILIGMGIIARVGCKWFKP